VCDLRSLSRSAVASARCGLTNALTRLAPQGLDLVEGYLPPTTRAMMLDGSTEKIEQLVAVGEQAEEALNVLVMLSQLLLLRGELGMEKGQFEAAHKCFSEAYTISLKISDEVAAARCKCSEGMLLHMKKDVKGYEQALDEAIRLCLNAGDGKEEVETSSL
jgi:tetratricopeptide (TPR) repeat protein